MTTENKKKIDEYWTERALQQEQNAQIVADRYMAQIGQSLADYKHQLVSEIEKFYARYAVDNKMTHAEAKQYLTDKERREFKHVTLERFREMALNPDTPTPLLDALSYRHRISRKEALLAEIERLTAELYGKPDGIHDKVTEALSDVYIKGKIHQAKNLAHFGIIEKPILGVDAVKHKMASNWSGKTFSTNVWGHDAAVYKSISDIINKGLTGGWSIDRMARALSERTGVAYHRADTLVRTETTFYNNLATLDTIKELGGDHYEIVAVLDSRTSEICRLENHEVHSVKEYEPCRTAPPFHVRCRSTIRPTVKSDKPSPYFDILQNDGSVKLATEQRSLDEIFAGWEREGEEVKEKLFAKDGEKVYNQGMSSIDLMAKQRSFVVGNDIRVNAKKLSGTEFDFWVQDNTKKIRDTVFNVQSSLKELNDFPTPTVVFLKKSRLPGFAGYDYKQDILFVSDALHSEIEFAKVLSDNYFAAQNITDTMVHELTHKKHWDSAKAFYKANKKRYNSVEQAMSELNSPLVSYVKEQLKHDYNYLYSISDNAAIAFYNDNINELVAEVGVLGDKVTDPNLLNKVKEVLSWK
ncbi:minor capsid protein [Streptococcus mitis]|uniref:Phage Mu protein F like protein n=1 Tax=Streptococcus mitis TaxID=28037 RepID=A0A3R9REG1_STRMT|nr:minor capsid protein [Streptococcus mitis]RSJ12896.1 Phage Mu protein F like protein [Streptococcus mitis]